MEAGALTGPWSAATLWAAFLLGLTGGFGHCLMMCGPFVAAASLAEGRGTALGSGQAAVRTGRAVGLFQVTYHVGRITTYALIGVLLGMLGEAGALESLAMPWSPAAFTRYLKLFSGLLLVVTGLVLLLAPSLGRRARLPEPTRFITSRPWFSRATERFSRGGGWSGLPLGMLMGLLPCMPLLPVELAALASGYPALGAVTMLAFGIGTVPALAGFGYATGLVGARARGAFAYTAGAIVLGLGGLIVLQAIQKLSAAPLPPMMR